MTTSVAQFTGTTAAIYTQYLDFGAGGRTLVVQPAGTYTIGVADGWPQLPPIPGDGNWASSGVTSVLFPAVPGVAAPGAFTPAYPGMQRVGVSGALPAADMRPPGLEVTVPAAHPEPATADEDAAAAAGAEIFAEIRDRLGRMNETVGVLRRAQKRR